MHPENPVSSPSQAPSSGTEKTPPSRWTRRRVLGWLLGGGVAALGSGALFKWLTEGEPSSENSWWGWREDVPYATMLTQGAALLAFVDLNGVQLELDRALKAAPSHAPARLVRACFYMQHAQWESAREELAHPRLSDTPEARFLLELATRRPHSPDWRHAFFDSWQALGRPDFHQSALLPAPFTPNLVLLDALPRWSQATPALCLPLLALHPPLMNSDRAPALEQVRVCESWPLLMALRDQLIALPPAETSRASLLPEVDSRLARLSASAPRTLQLALLSFLGQTDPSAPFTPPELGTLESFADLPEWKQPSSEVFFQQTLALFQGVLAAPAHHAWRVAISAQGLHLAQALLRRAQVSKPHLSEDAQHWLGKLLWAVGARLRVQPSHLELDMGLRLQRFGSELTLHGDTRMQSIEAWMELGRWEQALERAAYERWPLAALQEESCAPRAHQEHDWLRAFTTPGPLP